MGLISCGEVGVVNMFFRVRLFIIDKLVRVVFISVLLYL